MNYKDINRVIGSVDLFLLDQILKGRFQEGSVMLDAGCGEGRNLVYFLKNDYRVLGVDQNPTAVQLAKGVAKQLKAGDRAFFETATIENLPFPANSADHVICCSVLHFAQNNDHFFQMFDKLHQSVKPGGTIFLSMASDFRHSATARKAWRSEGATCFIDQEMIDTLVGRYNLAFMDETREFSFDDKSSCIVNFRKIGKSCSAIEK